MTHTKVHSGKIVRAVGKDATSSFCVLSCKDHISLELSGATLPLCIDFLRMKSTQRKSKVGYGQKQNPHHIVANTQQAIPDD